MIMCMVPQAVLGQIGEIISNHDIKITNPSSSANDGTDSDSSVHVLGEVIEKRTETTKTFRMSDWRLVAADYGKTIHFADDNGKWQDYDNTLSFYEADSFDVEDFAGYENKVSNISVKLANNSNSNHLLKIQKDGYKISLHLVGANKAKAVEIYETKEKPEENGFEAASELHKFSSGAIYKNILPSVDLEYIIFGGAVKENIIVKENNGTNTFTFELKLNSLVPTICDDGSVDLNDETSGNTVLVIPAGYMYDADGASSYAVSYSIVHTSGKKYRLTVTADAEWLNADERVYPVTIDPTVEAFKTTVTTYDTYITQNAPDLNDYTRFELLAGYYGADTNKECHVLIRPASLPELPDSAVVVNAKMCLAHMPNGTEHTSVNIGAVRITSAWDSNNVTWNTKPDYDPSGEIYDFMPMNVSTELSYVGFDITRLVQQWYNGTADNYGVALVPLAGNGNGRIYFGSSDGYGTARPNLYVSYFDTKGLEEIWTYSSHGAGNAGTGYVNGYNGNLVFVHGDMSTEGSILPIAVSHVYNDHLAGMEFTSADDINAPLTSDFNNMLVGKGFKLSVQETITEICIDESDYYVYNDADGTELYFVDTEEYGIVSENGYGLTITLSGSQKKLKDEYGNEKLFDSRGRLIKINDVNGNVKKLNYTSDRLTSITYLPSGETDEIPQFTFTYNSNNALSRITNGYNPADYVEFSYSPTYNGNFSTSSSGYLRRISYSNGESCVYTYDSNGKLSNTCDEDTGYSVYYTYNNNRVAEVREVVGYTSGQKLGYIYKDKMFSVRTSGNDDVYNNADDILTTCLFDNYGRAFCSYSSDVSGSEIYGTSYIEYTATEVAAKTNNKIKTDSVKGLTRENLVLDGSFENLSGWTTVKNGTGYNQGYGTGHRVHGARSLLYSSRNVEGLIETSQTVSIPSAGTYTLSAYVKTTSMSPANALENGGVYLMLDGESSEKITASTKSNIQNGWQRISVTKTYSSSTSATVKIKFADIKGYAYIDCVQLEKSDNPSDFNLINNGGLRGVNGWTGDMAAVSSEASRGKVAKLVGAPNGQKSASQTVTLNSPLDTTFMLSGWARANSADLIEECEEAVEADEVKRPRKFGLKALLTYSDSSTEEKFISFNPDNVNWQYVSLAIVPQHADQTVSLASITVSAVYDYNANVMFFDDISLTVEPAKTYEYDENGNLEQATNADGNTSMMDYAQNGVDLEGYTSITGEQYDYNYRTVDGVDTHQVETASKTSGGVTQTLNYTYDTFGNITSTVLSASGTDETVTSSAVYSEDGNYLVKSIDSLGNITEYNYNTLTRLLNYVQNANSKRTAYLYDSRERVTTVYLDNDKDGVCDAYEPAVSYLYVQNRLSGINTSTTAYTLTYDSFGNTVAVKAGDNTLATYTYAQNNGKLLRLDYGNGDYEEYVYDKLDRLISVLYNGVAEYVLSYDANGQVYSLVDGATTHLYNYDSTGRLITAYQKDVSGNITLAVSNSYDDLGRATGSSYLVGDRAMTYDLTYKENSSLVSASSMPDCALLSNVSYTYDKFDRLVKKEISMSSNRNLIEEYEYYTYTKTVNAVQQTFTTGLVSKVVLKSVYGSTVLSSDEYAYTYDNLGNIRTVKKNGTLSIYYEYDSLGQLVCESDVANGYAYVYTYDNSGNITVKYTFPYSAGAFASDYLRYMSASQLFAVNYGYSTGSWGDMLTNFNGTAITYDEIGNPSNWHNALSMSWDKRELSSLVLNDNGTLSFSYNSSGLRTQKTYTNGNSVITHDYLLDGTNIISETVTESINNTSYTLYYLYDGTGSIGFIYNNVYYYFQKNLQGDVVRILGPSGDVATEYTYDAWGNVVSVTGSLADTIGHINPFRYRSYYYDTETGFYYLQSRYYDPFVGRFLNADRYASTGQGIIGCNMFAYCNNNPVIYKDETGQFLKLAVLVVVVVVCVVSLTSCENNTGAGASTPPDDYTKNNSRDDNCYSYAFDLSEASNPGDYYANLHGTEKMYDRKDIYEPEEVADMVLDDMYCYGKDVRIVEDPKDKLDDEYIVAMKTSDRKMMFTGRADYHFAVQLSDGTWADKPGNLPSRWNKIDGTAVVWDHRIIKNYYNSDTIYFAVKK